MSGRVERLWIKRAHRGPMDAAPELRLVEGQGIDGNANQGGWRQVTVISREVFERVRAELSPAVDPAMRRANVMVSGVDLTDARGLTLVIGACRVLIRGETRPCERMDEAHPGLRDALSPPWRGGAFGKVLEGGTIREGDPAWLEDESGAEIGGPGAEEVAGEVAPTVGPEVANE